RLRKGDAEFPSACADAPDDGRERGTDRGTAQGAGRARGRGRGSGSFQPGTTQRDVVGALRRLNPLPLREKVSAKRTDEGGRGLAAAANRRAPPLPGCSA